MIEKLLPPNTVSNEFENAKLKQTHISYVIITTDHAYKIKKPVDFGFLDFTTIEKRLFYCKEEVRLNSRLAEGVYLGIVPVTCDGSNYEIGGSGEIVDYAVKMRRLDENHILRNMLSAETATSVDMERLGVKIASFHKRAATSGTIEAFGSPDTVGRNCTENFQQTLPYIGRTISAETHKAVKTYSDNLIARNAELMALRADKGLVADCHGDLHTDHISFDDGIHAFDCIEFNERFRFSDVISDIAFLLMDLEFYSRGDLARTLEASYFNATGDEEGKKLLDFYKCYRAFVRGKVEGLKLYEAEEPEDEKLKAEADARRYFHLSRMYAEGGYRPTLILVRGLSCSGKSSLARELSAMTGMKVLSSDAIRKELHGITPDKRVIEPYGKGIYSDEATVKTYSTMAERAKKHLSSGRSVIMDATFSLSDQIDAAKTAAHMAGSAFYALECTVDDETAAKRFALRDSNSERISDATMEIYLKQKEAFEQIDPPAAILSPAASPGEQARAAIKKLFMK